MAHYFWSHSVLVVKGGFKQSCGSAPAVYMDSIDS